MLLNCRSLVLVMILVAQESMAQNPKHPPGPPMTLGNMRELGVEQGEKTDG
jgi:hypothetical protein